MSKLNKFIIEFDEDWMQRSESVFVYSENVLANIFYDLEGLRPIPQDGVQNTSGSQRFEFYACEKTVKVHTCGQEIILEREAELIDKRDLIIAIKESNHNNNGVIDAFKLIEILDGL